MAQIKQVGIGRKSTGTIDGITYYTLNGKTYARTTPTMPASVYNTTEARIRQAIFKMMPYVVTILVLIFTSRKNRPEDQPPASLGLSYFREER